MHQSLIAPRFALKFVWSSVFPVTSGCHGDLVMGSTKGFRFGCSLEKPFDSLHKPSSECSTELMGCDVSNDLWVKEPLNFDLSTVAPHKGRRQWEKDDRVRLLSCSWFQI